MNYFNKSIYILTFHLAYSTNLLKSDHSLFFFLNQISAFLSYVFLLRIIGKKPNKGDRWISVNAQYKRTLELYISQEPYYTSYSIFDRKNLVKEETSFCKQHTNGYLFWKTNIEKQGNPKIKKKKRKLKN